MSTVKNICVAKDKTCKWWKTDLATWKRWHTGTDIKFTFTTMGSTSPMIVFSSNVTNNIRDKRFRKVMYKLRKKITS